MDALKFIEERNRMCDYYTKEDGADGCADCPECDSACNVVRYVTPEYIAAVEKWSQEHPRKTRHDVFLEQWPNCMIDDDGVVGICPRNVDNKCICNLERFYDFNACPVCRHKFWMHEVE